MLQKRYKLNVLGKSKEKSLVAKGSAWWNFKLGVKGYLTLDMPKIGQRILTVGREAIGKKPKKVYTGTEMEGRKDREELQKTICRR